MQDEGIKRYTNISTNTKEQQQRVLRGPGFIFKHPRTSSSITRPHIHHSVVVFVEMAGGHNGLSSV